MGMEGKGGGKTGLSVSRYLAQGGRDWHRKKSSTRSDTVPIESGAGGKRGEGKRKQSQGRSGGFLIVFYSPDRAQEQEIKGVGRKRSLVGGGGVSSSDAPTKRRLRTRRAGDRPNRDPKSPGCPAKKKGREKEKRGGRRPTRAR